MANRISIFIKKRLLGKKHNLVSLDDHYEVMRTLLRGIPVTGIIDAGASYGRVSKKLLQKFPQAEVFAFEPNPLFREALEEVARKDSRIHPCFAAVSDFEGTAEFYMTKARGYASLFAPTKGFDDINPVAASVQNLAKVNVVTIDRWVGRNGDIPIQLMKFDIQGGELKALSGATRVLQSSVLLVYTEIWFRPTYDGGALFGDIDSCLCQNGFELFDIYKPHYDKRGRLSWANAIYIHSKRLG
jgi:FkbM family methyltransferase